MESLNHGQHIKKKYVDIHYSAKQNNNFTSYSEYWLSVGQLNLNNDRICFIDRNEKLDVVQFTAGI